jgi:hypothetical protein
MARVRYERKYLVPNAAVPTLRKAIAPFVRPDTFAPLINGNPQYTVKSIYFDSPSNASFFEKLEGFKNRKKLRIRGYDQQTSDSEVFFEIKRKLENRIAKTRAKLPFAIALDILVNNNRDAHLSPGTKEYDDIGRFLYNMHRFHQTPRNLVIYDREPYHGKLDAGVRITFDKNIRSKLLPQLHELYQDEDLKLVWPDHFILEIKYFTDHMPSWAASIVQQFKLRHEALSKYAEGLTCHNQYQTIIAS